MKNLIFASALTLAATMAVADTGLSLVGTRSFTDGEQYRIGLRSPIKTFNYGFTFDAWILTETPKFESTYLGLGFGKRLVGDDRASLNAVIGYSANFNNIHNPRGSSWSYGLSGTVMF